MSTVFSVDLEWCVVAWCVISGFNTKVYELYYIKRHNVAKKKKN